MTPYYEADGVTLYHGDCLTVLKAPDVRTRAGLVIADPPYGIAHPCNYAGRGRAVLAPCHDYPDVHGDDRPYDPTAILDLDLPTVLWGANHYADRLPSSGGWLVWDKERPDDLDQATCEVAWTNYVKGVRRFRHLWHGMMRASERGENYHPTQKPAALTSWILSLRWTPRPPAVVLDPYCGSGSAGVAATRAGYGFIGIEREAPYIETTRRRIAAVLSQGVLDLGGAA